MSSEDFTNVRLETDGGIPYKLVASSLDEGIDGQTGTEQLVIRVSDIDAFLDEILPQSSFDGVTTPRINLPRLMPGTTWLSAVKAHIEAWDKTRPINLYGFDSDPIYGHGPITGDPRSQTYGQYAAVTIDYATISRDQFREITTNVGGEYLQIPQSSLKLSTGTSPSGTTNSQTNVQTDSQSGTVATAANKDFLLSAYKIIPTSEWTYKFKPLMGQTWSWSKAYALLGKVNSAQNSTLCENAVKETVLFTGVSATRIYNLYRRTGYGVLLELKFSQRMIEESGEVFGWNHTYSPKDGKWKKLERANNPGVFLYELANIAALLAANVS